MALDRQNMKQIERETELYKAFMKVAKKITYLEYGKWKIVPDPADPLRKFTLNKEFGWATLKVGVYLKDTYKRGVYDDSRYDYRGMISYSGLYADKTGMELKMVSVLKVRPRLAKDLIEEVNTKIIPNFCKAILDENEARDKMKKDIQEHIQEISRVKGLQKGVKIDTWREPLAILKGCPLNLTLERGKVNIEGSMSYADLERMRERMGWGE